MLMSLEAMTDLDDYEITFAKMLRELVNRNHEAALNMALRLEAIAPEDKLVQCNKMIRLGVAGEHERALETYRGLGFSEDQQRRSAIAGTTRIIAGSAHALGQYDLELELRRKLLRYYPGLLLFQLDLLGPFAALAEIDSLHAVVEDGLSRPGTRGFVDYQVWTNSGTLRGHGYHEEAIQFVDWYLERRPARPEDEARKGQINNYAFLLYYAERWEESRAAFETNIASGRLGTGGIETARTWLGLLAARRGDSEFANEIIAEQIDGWDDPYNRSTPYIFRARFAALRGDLDEAVQMLQEAAAHGAKLGHGARHDIDLEPLFGYPPFEELIGS